MGSKWEDFIYAVKPPAKNRYTLFLVLARKKKRPAGMTGALIAAVGMSEPTNL